MLAAYGEGRHYVSAAHVRKAAQDTPAARSARSLLLAIGAALITAVAALAYWFGIDESDQPGIAGTRETARRDPGLTSLPPQVRAVRAGSPAVVRMLAVALILVLAQSCVHLPQRRMAALATTPQSLTLLPDPGRKQIPAQVPAPQTAATPTAPVPVEAGGAGGAASPVSRLSDEAEFHPEPGALRFGRQSPSPSRERRNPAQPGLPPLAPRPNPLRWSLLRLPLRRLPRRQRIPSLRGDASPRLRRARPQSTSRCAR